MAVVYSNFSQWVMTFCKSILVHRKRRNGIIVLVSCVFAVATTTSFTPSVYIAYQHPKIIMNLRLCRYIPERCIGQRRLFRTNILMETSDGDNVSMDDETLLHSVSLEQLVQLCDQLRIPNNGKKLELLLRLRNHAAVEAELARQRNLARIQKVENGSTDENSKERYEIVNGPIYEDPDDSDDNGFFFFELPEVTDDLKRAQNTASVLSNGRESPRRVLTSDQVTAPPPPTEPNADGERVVTVYSTSELNDLTSIAAAQPGRGMSLDALSSDMGGSSNYGNSEPQPWDNERKTSETTTRQLEQAEGRIVELVSTLLSMSGAPAFASLQDDHENSAYVPYRGNGTRDDRSFGFNPAIVPVELLTSSSQSLRAGRGEVLQGVLRQFELQAIGQDGTAGDNIQRGGGHYREVMKVRAFLEGYRRAEVRRLARETTALLLDRLILEGVEGLDTALAAMVRSNDDTEDYAGALNDSLVDFLNDVIRQKEKEVEARYGARRVLEQQVVLTDKLLLEEDDAIEKYWNVSIVDGQRIETLDPNNIEVKKILQAEVAKTSEGMLKSIAMPDTAPEQLLLLLKLLRERIKAEAAFSSDEKGRNLRLLAYCLRLTSPDEWERLILKQLGNSLDRLDSFIELVTSSIEYGESASYELRPATTQRLNMLQVRLILELSTELRGRQNSRAAGLRP